MVKWWEEGPLIISALQYQWGEDPYENLKKHVAVNDYNVEQLFHLFGEGSWAYYNEEKHGEKLERYLKEAHACGLRVIVYDNIHSMPMTMEQEHPDWPCVDRKGKHILTYDGVQYVFCLNSSYADYLMEQLEGMCSHDIDGIFLDGPSMPQGGCYCPHCRGEFLSMFGHSMDTSTYEEILQFNIKTCTDILKRARETIDCIKPGTLLYLNNSALCADVNGRHTRYAEPYVDMLGAEGGFVWADRTTPLWNLSAMAKQIETQAKGKPTVIFIAGDYKPWSYCMHTAAETRLYYAQSLANGANIWYGIHGPASQFETPGGYAAHEFNRFIKENSSIYKDTKSFSRVALIWSQDSANFYSSSVERTDFSKEEKIGKTDILKGDHRASFLGFVEVLIRAHVQFDVLDEESIEEGALGKYDLAILPTVACMRDSVAEKCHAFVEGGGNLISTMDTGFYGANGKSAAEPKLANLQGITTVEGFAEYKNPGSGYLRIISDSDIMTNVSWKYTPSPTLAIRAVPATVANICAEYCTPMPGRYGTLPGGWFPAIWTHEYGKGRSIYFAGAVGEFYNSKANPDTQVMLKNAVLSSCNPVVTSDAPGSVEIVLRKQKDRFIIHFINATGEMVRPLQKILPVHDVRVMLNIGWPLHSITPVTSGTHIDFESTDSGCSFTIPKIGDYEVFVIK